MNPFFNKPAILNDLRRVLPRKDMAEIHYLSRKGRMERKMIAAGESMA